MFLSSWVLKQQLEQQTMLWMHIYPTPDEEKHFVCFHKLLKMKFNAKFSWHEAHSTGVYAY